MLINIKNKYQLIFDLNIHFQFRKVEIRNGLCSKNYNNDMHMLLVDFDNIPLQYVISDLQGIQYKFGLPDIYVLESSKGHYHAYSFCSRPFMNIIQILAYLIFIDKDFFRLGCARGYYTLRYSAKRGENVKLITILKSKVKFEMSPLEVTLNEYFTTNV